MANLEKKGIAVQGPQLTGREKAAALLLSMGKQQAIRILKHFDEEEMRALVKAMADLGTVSRPVLDSIIEEFSHQIVEGGDLQGTVGDAEKLLKSILPPDQVAKIMSDVRIEDKRAVWPRLSLMPETVIAQYLVKEHPQIAAYVLSKASPVSAAAVLELMPNELRKELLRRMLTIKPVLDQPRQILERSLRDELLYAAGGRGAQEVHARLADIINRMKRENMDEAFQALAEFRPKEAEKVKALLFTFDDIIKLRPADVAKLLDQVPTERVIQALHGAEPRLSNLILGSLGARARRMIEQELASGATPSARDVNKARRAIADLALELADRGTIDLHAEEE